jgi:hypothetical protein
VDGSRVVVSYVATTGSQGEGIAVATRDGTISGDGILWDNLIRPCSDAGFDPGAQSIASLGNQDHVMIAKATSIQHLRTSTRTGNGSWSVPTFFDFYGEDEFQNHRRKIIMYAGAVLLSYTSQGNILFRSNDGSGWNSPIAFKAQEIIAGRPFLRPKWEPMFSGHSVNQYRNSCGEKCLALVGALMKTCSGRATTGSPAQSPSNPAKLSR